MTRMRLIYLVLIASFVALLLAKVHIGPYGISDGGGL
jgi:hypothetical protein